MEKINYVCSFGNVCHTGILLQRHNIKLCSYPFDWIVSDLNIINYFSYIKPKTKLS